MASKDKFLHMITELFAVIILVPYFISLIYRYKLKSYDIIILLSICILTFIIDGYLFYTWFNYKLDNTTRQDMLKSLIRQSIRYQIASKQDKNKLLAVLHANYAATYMFVIKEYFTTQEILKILKNGKNMKEFYKRVIETQDKSTRDAIIECPSYSGNEINDFLTMLAGE